MVVLAGEEGGRGAFAAAAGHALLRQHGLEAADARPEARAEGRGRPHHQRAERRLGGGAHEEPRGAAPLSSSRGQGGGGVGGFEAADPADPADPAAAMSWSQPLQAGGSSSRDVASARGSSAPASFTVSTTRRSPAAAAAPSEATVAAVSRMGSKAREGRWTMAKGTPDAAMAGTMRPSPSLPAPKCTWNPRGKRRKRGRQAHLFDGGPRDLHGLRAAEGGHLRGGQQPQAVAPHDRHQVRELALGADGRAHAVPAVREAVLRHEVLRLLDGVLRLPRRRRVVRVVAVRVGPRIRHDGVDVLLQPPGRSGGGGGGGGGGGVEFRLRRAGGDGAAEMPHRLVELLQLYSLAPLAGAPARLADAKATVRAPPRRDRFAPELALNRGCERHVVEKLPWKLPPPLPLPPPALAPLRFFRRKNTTIVVAAAAAAPATATRLLRGFICSFLRRNSRNSPLCSVRTKRFI